MKHAMPQSYESENRLIISSRLQKSFDIAPVTTDSIESLFSKIDLLDPKNQEVFMNIIKQKVSLLVAQNPEKKPQIEEYLARVVDKNNSVLAVGKQKIRHEIFGNSLT